MRLALRAAMRGIRTVAPNPPVGAVIVRENQLLAIGHHRQAGGPHAEIDALQTLASQDLAQGATLYVTLEPCSTHGRTPPCTDAILNRGFVRVVAGCVDPNPLHAGRGLDHLRQSGLEVSVGVLENETRRIIRVFAKSATSDLPWVIVKAARTLDGRLTLPPSGGRWLSNPRAQRLVHRCRARVDAVLVGAETARRDDPHLDVRGLHAPRQPRPVILTRSGNLPQQLWLMQPERRQQTIQLTGPSMRQSMQSLRRLGIRSVLVEGGAEVIGHLIDERLIDEVLVVQTPYISDGPVPMSGGHGLAKLEETIRLHDVTMRRYDSDLIIHAMADNASDSLSAQG